jgi:hypothetical protein
MGKMEKTILYVNKHRKTEDEQHRSYKNTGLNSGAQEG